MMVLVLGFEVLINHIGFDAVYTLYSIFAFSVFISYEKNCGFITGKYLQ